MGTWGQGLSSRCLWTHANERQSQPSPGSAHGEADQGPPWGAWPPLGPGLPLSFRTRSGWRTPGSHPPVMAVGGWHEPGWDAVTGDPVFQVTSREPEFLTGLHWEGLLRPYCLHWALGETCYPLLLGWAWSRPPPGAGHEAGGVQSSRQHWADPCDGQLLQRPGVGARWGRGRAGSAAAEDAGQQGYPQAQGTAPLADPVLSSPQASDARCCPATLSLFQPQSLCPSGLGAFRAGLSEEPCLPHQGPRLGRPRSTRHSRWSLGRQPLPFRESAGKASLAPKTSRSGSWGPRRTREGVFCAGSRCRGELRLPKRSRRTRPAPSAWTRATQPSIRSQTVGVRPAHQGAHSSHTATESPNGPLREVRVQPLKIELSLLQK